MTHYPLGPEFWDWDAPENWEKIQNWKPPDGLEMEYRTVPGPEEGQEIQIKIYRPKDADGPLPMIMDVHGGGFVAGTYENDNTRVACLAMEVPAVVVSLNYRLAPEHVFPKALMDCDAVWRWMYQHAGELGGDPEKMGLYGTSAGGNLCAGLAFYERDNDGPSISLNVLNTACLGLGPTLSAEQMRFGGAIITGQGLADGVKLYLGGLKGQPPSYYGVPNTALDFSGLPPTFLIAAECDPLRDESLEYMDHLLHDAIPVELHLIPGALHGFNAVPNETVDWLNKGIVLAYRREFFMKPAMKAAQEKKRKEK